MKNYTLKTKTVLLIVFLLAANVVPIQSIHAQGTADSKIDLSDKNFKFSVCDGPAGLNDPDNHKNEPGWVQDQNFVACDFSALMNQIQKLINVLIALGVLAAIAGFCYAGFLYIRGREADRTKASGMFQKIGLGFIIMLSAWFIVYQLLTWLTKNPGFTKLLGSP